MRLKMQMIARGNRAHRPETTRATEIAAVEAPSAAIAIRSSNLRTSSSSTNTAPAIGELNAVARPAPAPAASRTRQSGQLHAADLSDQVRNVRPHLHARTLAAECQPETDGKESADKLDDQQHGGAGGNSPSQHHLHVWNSASGCERRNAAHEPRRDRNRPAPTGRSPTAAPQNFRHGPRTSTDRAHRPPIRDSVETRLRSGRRLLPPRVPMRQAPSRLPSRCAACAGRTGPDRSWEKPDRHLRHADHAAKGCKRKTTQERLHRPDRSLT